MLDKKNLAWLLAFAAGALGLFISALLIGKTFGLDQSAVATVCSATALAISALIAFLALQHNRKNTQEPWRVTYRELHREFWNDPDIAKVRSWICCDEAYRTELLPVLSKRLSGQVSVEEYKILEILDKFLALMLRAVHPHARSAMLPKEEQIAFKGLNYYWWLHQARNRGEIYKYTEVTLDNLFPFMGDATFHELG